jgi:hypothetical protein
VGELDLIAAAHESGIVKTRISGDVRFRAAISGLQTSNAYPEPPRAWRPMWPRAGRLSARHAARTTAQGPRSWNGRRRMNRSSRARTAHLRTRPFPDRRRGKAQRISCGLGLHVRGADVLVYVSMRTSASLRSAARSKARGDEAPHRHLHVVQPLSGLVRMMWAPS